MKNILTINNKAEFSRYFWPSLVLALILLINIFINPDFFHLQILNGRLHGSLVDVINRGVPVGLLALGMCLVIATGGIDLSVGAVMAIGGAVSANLIVYGVDSLWIIISLGLLAGLLSGAWNGLLVAVWGVQPFVTTLILMVAGRGIAQLINAGQIVTFHHERFAFLGSGQVLGLPTPVVILAGVAILVSYFVRKTAIGLYIEAVGCNASASYYSGISEKGIKFFVYCFAGMSSALAGIIITADIRGADGNNAGLWLELDAILAVVLGGASMMGGRFSIILTLLGVFIMQAISTSILMSGFLPKYNLLIKAILIITILLIQSKQFQNQVKMLIRRFIS